MVGTGRGAELGILIRGGEALEKAGRLQVVLLDKTGTITKGEPAVTDIEPLDPPGGNPANLLRLAASAEQNSEHPLAAALVRRAKADGVPLATAAEFQAMPGLGVRAKVDDREVLVGNERLLAEEKIDFPLGAQEAAKAMTGAGKTPMFVAVERRPWGIIAVADTVRESSAPAILLLRFFGLDCWMLTGDNPRTAEAVGKQVGITRVFASVLPDRKAAVVREAQENGLRVAMVGDGINDAPALAQADLGIAMRSGTDVAMEAGDIVLMRSDLLDVVAALLLARKTLRVIQENLFFAFVYNIIAIPLAACNVLNPMIASATMALSSVSVVTNSLRLRRFQPPKWRSNHHQ
jgi:Cu+-exporting ATPase